MPAPKDPTKAYARSVVAGRIVANRLVRLACQRHLDDLKQQKKKRLRWELERATHAIRFFHENLRLTDERPFTLEPFQEFIVGSVFGWLNAAGYRRFRNAYIEIGKGNGKSPLAAGVGLYGLVCDSQDDPQAEIYSAAVTREQAGIVFKDASNMSETSPELAEVVEVNAASLIMASTRSSFRPVSSEHRSLDGKRVHMALIDEIHEHPHALVVDKMRAGTKARRNALIFEITNSGWDRTSVCWDHHDYSVKLLEGTEKNDAWFAYVCGLDEGDDWKNEKVWLKANPGLGSVLPIEYLREQATEAKAMPSKENICRRLNFCEWTEQSIIWLPIEDWEKCRAPRPLAALRGSPCFAGIDLASTSDFTALLLAFPDGDDLDVVRHFWLPENARHAKRSERNRLLIKEWARRGLVTLTPGEVTDYNFIEAEVVKAMRDYRIQAIGFDRWNSSQLISNLMADGAPMVEFGQGVASMSSPSKQLERLVRLGGIRHGDDPVLRWMAGNVCVAVDHAGNIKPDKASSGEKIDGIIALIMAIGCWMNHQDQDTSVIYNDPIARPEGLLTL